MAPPVILVVDDDPDLRETLVDIFEDAGYATEAAEHGAAALELLQRAPDLPALVLLDMTMPVMDGETFAARMRQDPRLAQLPIVVYTARSDRERVAAQLHAAGSVAKPLKLGQLLAVVGKVIEQSKAPARLSSPPVGS